MKFEGTVKFFRKEAVGPYGIVEATVNGKKKEVFIAARECADGFNGHRVYPDEGFTVTGEAIPDGKDCFATSWQIKK